MEVEEQRGSSDFGILLRRHRLAAGLSQEALAERARMSSDGISALERGHRRTPQRETLALLAGALALDDEQQKAFEAAASRPSLPRRGSVTVGPWPDAAAEGLPLSLTSFVGRESELDEITALVRDHRLVTVTGTGGVGKTQTALQVANAMREAGGATVRFVGLAPLGDPSLVASAIAAALNVQEVPNRPLLETLTAFLKSKSMLLILDNCEHVVAQAATIAEVVLSGCPGVRILATSREPLRAAGEFRYRLPSLNASDGLALFRDRAKAADHRFALTHENEPSVAEVCRRLDGIPLAIELAAARVNLLAPKALAAKLDDRFRLLTGSPRTAVPRQQTMRATIDWSYKLLSAQEQLVFERISIFAGGCTFDAATAVCVSEDLREEDILDVLSSLIDKSLLLTDTATIELRYQLLESFRVYARERLSARGDGDAVARRHATACLQLAKKLDRAFNSGSDDDWYLPALADLDNWRSALHWALTKRGDVALGQLLTARLNVIWTYVASLEGRRWISLAFGLVNDETKPEVIADLAYADATVACQLREYDRQLECSERAINQYRTVNDAVGTARAQSLASHALFHLGRLKEARTLAEEALSTGREVGDGLLAAFSARVLAVISALEGNLDAARRHIAEALAISNALGSNFNAAKALVDLSCCEFYVGDAELMRQHAAAAFEKLRKFGDPNMDLWPLDLMSASLILLSRYDEAREYARKMFEAANGRNEAFEAFALEYLAVIAALRPHDTTSENIDPCAKAARILGFTNKRLASIGSESGLNIRGTCDEALAALRNALGPDSVADLMATGAAMGEEQVIQEALTT